MATYLDVLAKILFGERTSAPEINRLVSRRVPPIEGGRMLRNAVDLMQYAPATTGMAKEGVKTALDEKGRTVTADTADKVVSDTPVEYVFQANPSCILEGDEILIDSLTRPIAGSKMDFLGKVFTITSRGKSSRYTPNHPILTAFGFIPAQLLNTGDYIINYLRSEVLPPHNVKDYEISTVEDVFASMLKSSPGPVLVLPTSSLDFHGDTSIDKKVQVINATSRLRDKVYSGFIKRFSERGFIDTLKRLEIFFNSYGTVDEHGFWHFTSLVDQMALIRNELIEIFPRSRKVFEAESFDFKIVQDCIYNAMTASEFLTNRKGADVFISIHANHLSDLSLRKASLSNWEGNPCFDFNKDPTYSITRAAKALGYILIGLSEGMINFDKCNIVASKEKIHSNIYSFETPSNFIVDGAIFSSNCCSDCSRRDGMTVPAGTTLRSISHPNCCCAIVPRTEYKPFGSPTSGVDKSRGGAGKVGLGHTIAADRYQEFLKGLENS